MYVQRRKKRFFDSLRVFAGILLFLGLCTMPLASAEAVTLAEVQEAVTDFLEGSEDISYVQEMIAAYLGLTGDSNLLECYLVRVRDVPIGGDASYRWEFRTYLENGGSLGLDNIKVSGPGLPPEGVFLEYYTDGEYWEHEIPPAGWKNLAAIKTDAGGDILTYNYTLGYADGTVGSYKKTLDISGLSDSTFDDALKNTSLSVVRNRQELNQDTTDLTTNPSSYARILDYFGKNIFTLDWSGLPTSGISFNKARARLKQNDVPHNLTAYAPQDGTTSWTVNFDSEEVFKNWGTTYLDGRGYLEIRLQNDNDPNVMGSLLVRIAPDCAGYCLQLFRHEAQTVGNIYTGTFSNYSSTRPSMGFFASAPAGSSPPTVTKAIFSRYSGEELDIELLSSEKAREEKAWFAKRAGAPEEMIVGGFNTYKINSSSLSGTSDVSLTLKYDNGQTRTFTVPIDFTPRGDEYYPPTKLDLGYTTGSGASGAITKPLLPADIEKVEASWKNDTLDSAAWDEGVYFTPAAAGTPRGEWSYGEFCVEIGPDPEWVDGEETFYDIDQSSAKAVLDNQNPQAWYWGGIYLGYTYGINRYLYQTYYPAGNEDTATKPQWYSTMMFLDSQTWRNDTCSGSEWHDGENCRSLRVWISVYPSLFCSSMPSGGLHLSSTPNFFLEGSLAGETVLPYELSPERTAYASFTTKGCALGDSILPWNREIELALECQEDPTLFSSSLAFDLSSQSSPDVLWQYSIDGMNWTNLPDNPVPTSKLPQNANLQLRCTVANPPADAEENLEAHVTVWQTNVSTTCDNVTGTISNGPWVSNPMEVDTSTAIEVYCTLYADFCRQQEGKVYLKHGRVYPTARINKKLWLQEFHLGKWLDYTSGIVTYWNWYANVGSYSYNKLKNPVIQCSKLSMDKGVDIVDTVRNECYDVLSSTPSEQQYSVTLKDDDGDLDNFTFTPSVNEGEWLFYYNTEGNSDPLSLNWTELTNPGSYLDGSTSLPAGTTNVMFILKDQPNDAWQDNHEWIRLEGESGWWGITSEYVNLDSGKEGRWKNWHAMVLNVANIFNDKGSSITAKCQVLSDKQATSWFIKFKLKR